MTDAGTLSGLLAGVSEENLDDLLVRTPGFMRVVERSRASLRSAPPMSAEDLLAEALADQPRDDAGKLAGHAVPLYGSTLPATSMTEARCRHTSGAWLAT
jgi:hypothetical protein